MLMNEYVKLADVLEIVERYVAPRGRKGSVNLMREIESLPRIQIKELKCSVFIPDEWVRVYEEDAERRQIDTERLKISKSLKPCPFCGGKAELEEDMGYPYVVSCKNCGARVNSLENDKKGSVDAWNRRKE